MANRKKILPGFLLEKKHSTDLYGEVLRETVAGKRFDGPEFFAKVLSAPYPMDPVAVTDFFPAPGLRTTTEESIMPKAELEAKYAKLKDKPSKFSFFGRIESQHKMLPEPSPLTFATAPQLTLDAVKRHTEFISTFDAEPPTPGDLVIVRLREGDNGWNLQHGEYIELFEPGWDPEYAEAQFTAVMDKGIQDPIDLWLEEDFGPTDEEIAAGAAIHAAFEEALAEEALAEEAAAAAGRVSAVDPQYCLPTNPIPCYQMNKYAAGSPMKENDDGTWARVKGTAEDIADRKKAHPEVYDAPGHWWNTSFAQGVLDTDIRTLKYVVIHNIGPNSCGLRDAGPMRWMATHMVTHKNFAAHCKECGGATGVTTDPACRKKCGYGGICCPDAPPEAKVGWHYGVDQNGVIHQGVLVRDKTVTTGNLNGVQIGIEVNGIAIPSEEDFKSVPNWVELWGNGDEKEALKQIGYRSRYHHKDCKYTVKNSGNYNCGRTGMYNDTALDALAKLVHDLCLKFGIPMQRGLVHDDSRRGAYDAPNIPGIVGHDEMPSIVNGSAHLGADKSAPTGKCAEDPYACRKFDPGTRLTLKPGVPEKTESGTSYVGAAFDWDDFMERVKSYGAVAALAVPPATAADEETATG